MHASASSLHASASAYPRAAAACMRTVARRRETETPSRMPGALSVPACTGTRDPMTILTTCTVSLSCHGSVCVCARVRVCACVRACARACVHACVCVVLCHTLTRARARARACTRTHARAALEAPLILPTVAPFGEKVIFIANDWQVRAWCVGVIGGVEGEGASGFGGRERESREFLCRGFDNSSCGTWHCHGN